MVSPNLIARTPDRPAQKLFMLAADDMLDRFLIGKSCCALPSSAVSLMFISKPRGYHRAWRPHRRQGQGWPGRAQECDEQRSAGRQGEWRSLEAGECESGRVGEESSALV